MSATAGLSKAGVARAGLPDVVQAALGGIIPAAIFLYLAALRAEALRATALPDLLAAWHTLGPTSVTALREASRAAYGGLSALSFGVVAALFLVRRRPVRKLASLPPQIVAVAGAYVVTALALQPATATDWRVTALAGALLAAGLAGTIAASVALGRSFGVLPEARALVTWGPYRCVRHPVYIAEAVTFLGMSLAALSPLTVAIYALYVGLTVARASYEERVLAAAFPEYAAYRRATWACLPGVW